MINLLSKLEKKTTKPDIPSEVWKEWEEHPATKYIHSFIKEKQIELLDEILQPNVCVRTIRAKIETLEEILIHQPENVDV